MKYYRVVMNAFQKYPYIGRVRAKSKTAAIRLFIEHLTEAGFSRTRASTSSYTAIEITKKSAQTIGGGHAIGFEPIKVKPKGKRVKRFATA